MSIPYTFRIDRIDEFNEEDTELKISLALDKYPKYLIAREVSSVKKKMHWQGIVWSDDKHSTYQKYMERQFDEWKGKQRRSFAQVKKTESYEIYVSKDGTFTHVKGYTDDQVHELQSKAYSKEDIKIDLPDKDTGSEKLKEIVCIQIYKYIVKKYKKPSLLSHIDVANNIRQFYGKQIATFWHRALTDAVYIALGEHKQMLRSARLFNATLPECLQEEDLKQYDTDEQIYVWDPIEKENLNIE